MTATAPFPGRSLPRRLTVAVASALALLLGGATALTAAPPAAAVTPVEAETQELSTTVHLAVSAGTGGVHTSGSPLTVTATIEHSAKDPYPSGQVMLELNRTALVDRGAVAGWLSRGSAEGSFSSLRTNETAEIPAADAETPQTAQYPFSIPSAELGDLTPGVYAVRAVVEPDTDDEVTSTASAVTGRSVVVVHSGTGPVVPASVAVVMPVTAPTSNGLLTADELAQLTGTDGSLSAQLDTAVSTTSILAIDPAIPAAIRALGTAAPESATAWLERLTDIPNERFALQFADADLTAQARAGLESPLVVDDLSPFLDPARFASAPAATGGDEDADVDADPSPSPSASASATGEVTLPSTDELTAVPGAQEGIVWPRSDASSGDLAALSRYADGEGAVILPSTAFAEAENAAPIRTLGQVQDSSILVTDTPASTALSHAMTATGTRQGEGLSEAIAFLRFVPSSNRVLLGLSRSEASDPDALRTALSAVRSASAATTSLADILAQPAEELTLRDQDTSFADQRAQAVTTLLADEVALGAFSSALVEPAQLTVRERISILRLLGTAQHSSAETFAAATAQHRATTQTTLDAIGIQPLVPVQLISPSSGLPVWIRNDLPYPARVVLSAEPSNGRLDVQRTIEVDAQPQGNTQVLIPVEARVASGDVTVRLALESASATPIGTQRSVEVTVRAEWETIGLVILGVLVVLLIGVGIVRTVLRRRRTPAQDDDSSAQDDNGSSAQDDDSSAHDDAGEEQDSERTGQE